ncbi:MAG: HDIG domain-containing metalloprotein, partial [Clostridia bacterium]
KRELLLNISSERIRDELLKTITGGKILPSFIRFREIVGEVIPEIRNCFDFEQRTKHHCCDVYTHILKAVDNYGGENPIIKTALLLHDIGKPACRRYYDGSDHFKGHPVLGMKMGEEILRRLKFDRASEKKIKTLIQFHDVRLKGGMPQTLKLMNLMGDEETELLFQVMYADVYAQSEYRREEKVSIIRRGEENFHRAVSENLCRSLSGLTIDGNCAAEMGFKGSKIGAALHFALNGVINGAVENEREKLLRYIDTLTKMW